MNLIYVVEIEALSPCFFFRFLASGDHQRSISYGFRVGRSTVCTIVSITCRALWKTLSPIYVKCPSTPEEWGMVAHEFNTLWNFPNCVGAIDGKHIVTECPVNTGSMNYNYKGSFSTVSPFPVFCLLLLAGS